MLSLSKAGSLYFDGGTLIHSPPAQHDKTGSYRPRRADRMQKLFRQAPSTVLRSDYVQVFKIRISDPLNFYMIPVGHG